MASPLAHGLAGVAVYAILAPPGGPVRDRRPWALAAFAGAAADLDFLPGLAFADPSRYHHGVTHSLAATLVFALLLGLSASRPLGSVGRRILLFGVAYGTHLGLDYVTFDPSVPRGIPLLWPFSSTPFIASATLFWELHHGASWGAFVNQHNVGAVFIEAAILGPLVAALCVWRLGRKAGASVLVEAG
jgi:inner membrane protein